MLVDCFIQIETLLSKRSQMAGAPDEGKTKSKQDVGTQLNKADLDFALLKLQTWLQKFVTLSDLGFVCEQLVRLSEVSRQPVEAARRPTFSKPVSPKSPSSRDAVATVDQRREESVDFYVLETMHHIFAALNHHPSYYRQQDVIPLMGKGDNDAVTVVISDDAVDFCMQRLHFENSPAIQHAATQCLSMLSSHMLGSILPRFNERLAAARKDNELREYANYHKAISGLQFSIETESRFLVIVKYLEDLLPLLKKCERGVLRAEICTSLTRIFEHVLKPSSRETMEKYSKVPQFWELLENSFSIVLKWASRGKHALFCFEMLTKILALQPKIAIAPLHEKVWRWLTDGLRQKETRKKCLELLLIDLRGLPQNALKDDSVFVSKGSKDAQLKEMISKLLPHKFAFPEEEQVLTTSILVEIAHKHITFAMSDIFPVVLQKNSPYTSTQKSLTFKALAAVAQDLPAEVDKILPTTGPLLAHYVEDAKEQKEQKESDVLASALDCFPSIHMSNPEKTLRLAFLISKMTLFENRGITNAALLCLQRYALSNPQTTLLKTVDLFVDLIAHAANLDAQTLMRASNNLVFMVTMASEFVERSPEIAKLIPPADWLSVRQHIEGVVLIGLCHPEGWMRREMLLILLTASKPCFRELEERADQPPFLADELKISDPNLVVATPEEFFEDLAALLRSPRSEAFATIIGWAWSQMSPVVEDVRKKSLEELVSLSENEESFKLFKNRIYFLCLVLGPITLTGSIEPLPTLPLIRTESLMKVPEVARAPSSRLLEIDSANLRLSSMNSGSLGQKAFAFSRFVVEFLVQGKLDPRLDPLVSGVAEALGSVNLVAFPQLLHDISAVGETPPKSPDTKPQKQQVPEVRDAGVLSRRCLPRVLGSLFSRDVGSCPEAVKYLADLANQWLLEEPTVFENLPAEARLGMTTCLKRALQFHHEGKLTLLPEHKEGSPIKETLRLLTSQKFGQGKQGSEEAALQNAISAAICELANLVFPENLTNQMLGIMHEMAMNATVEASYRIAQQALKNFLSSHPSFLVHFVKMSIFETHGRDPRSGFKHISLYYCNAVILNWVESMPAAGPDDTRTPAIMLAVSLIHQSSSLPEARGLALRLASALATTSHGYALTVPYNLRLISPPSFPMYTRATRQYSEALSSNPANFKLIPSLLSEIVPLFENLSDLSRNNLLEILLPWLSNFVSLLDQLMAKSKGWSQECKERTMTVLTSLLTLTRACFSSSMSTTHISQAWNCLMASVPKEPVLALVQETVGYLHSYHANSPKPEERVLLRTVFIYLSRSAHGQLVANALISQLRSYPDLTTQPRADRQWKLQPPISSEMAAFELLTDLAFENVELFKDHLPVLLSNACILVPRSPQSNEMLYNLSLSLHCDNPAQSDDHGQVIIKHFAKHSPQILDRWVEACLSWACFAPDPYLVAQATAFLYSLQQGSLNYGSKTFIIARLALVLFECVRKGHDANVTQIVNFFQLPPIGGYSEDAFSLLMSVGRALLEHSRSDYFNQGCSVILQTFNYCPDQKVLATRMNALHHSGLWSAAGETKSADQAILDLVFKGLLVKSTFQPASSLLTHLALHYSNLGFDNGLLIVALLSNLLGALALFSQSAAAANAQKDALRPTNAELEKQIAAIGHLCQVIDVYQEVAQSDAEKRTAASNLRAVFTLLQKSLGSAMNGKDVAFSQANVLAAFFQSFHLLFAGTTRPKQLPLGDVKVSPAQKIVPQVKSEEKSGKTKGLFHNTLRNGISRPKDQTKVPLLVPVVVFQCVEFLKQHLNIVGLFRVPGDNNLIQGLKESFEQGQIVTLAEPNAVAGVLKLYFRELSESLVPETLYGPFIAIDETKDTALKLNVAKTVCKQLPAENRLTLNYLIHFLTVVAAQSSVNKMDATNLAMVFAPSLLRPPVEATGINLVRDLQQQQNVLEFMIKHYIEIFEEGPPNSTTKQSPATEENVNVTFNFIVQFFYRQIVEGVVESKQTLLVMFGYYLQSTPTYLNSRQILDLGEMVMVALQDAALTHTTENFGRLLVDKVKDPSELKNAFNFMRPRVKRTLKVGETGVVKTLDREQERFVAFTAFHSEPLIEGVLGMAPQRNSRSSLRSPPPPPPASPASPAVIAVKVAPDPPPVQLQLNIHPPANPQTPLVAPLSPKAKNDAVDAVVEAAFALPESVEGEAAKKSGDSLQEGAEPSKEGNVVPEAHEDELFG